MKQSVIAPLLFSVLFFLSGVSSISFADEEYDDIQDSFFQQMYAEDDDLFNNTETEQLQDFEDEFGDDVETGGVGYQNDGEFEYGYEPVDEED